MIAGVPFERGEYDPVLFMLRLGENKRQPAGFLKIIYIFPPKSLYYILKFSNRENWFASTIYGEMVKRYEIMSNILGECDDHEILDKIIGYCTFLWTELKPINKENIDTTLYLLKERLTTAKPINLISLTCPAYTIGREKIAKGLIKNRIDFFLNLTAKAFNIVAGLISEWHMYIWDPSALDDPILRKTIHPNLLAKRDLEEQLERNWFLFGKVANKISKDVKIKVVPKKYTELIPRIHAAKDILAFKEKENKFHSKGIERMLRHGREDYKRMGENIDEHRERFWHDSYIYTASVLEYGLNCERATGLNIMVSIESRLHHITGLRLYHLEYDDKKLLLPVWNYPSWIRSFYWVNEGNKNINDNIASTRERWRNSENWKSSSQNNFLNKSNPIIY